jgi:hypothetical protein
MRVALRVLGPAMGLLCVASTAVRARPATRRESDGGVDGLAQRAQCGRSVSSSPTPSRPRSCAVAAPYSGLHTPIACRRATTTPEVGARLSGGVCRYGDHHVPRHPSGSDGRADVRPTGVSNGVWVGPEGSSARAGRTGRRPVRKASAIRLLARCSACDCHPHRCRCDPALCGLSRMVSRLARGAARMRQLAAEDRVPYVVHVGGVRLYRRAQLEVLARR